MIVITGANGQLGRLVIDRLLSRGVAPDRIVAAVRTPAKAADLAARGVLVREGDYTRSDTLTKAFAGAERVLLISSNDLGDRVPQHRTVIDAAKAVGAGQLEWDRPHEFAGDGRAHLVGASRRLRGCGGGGADATGQRQ